MDWVLDNNEGINTIWKFQQLHLISYDAYANWGVTVLHLEEGHPTLSLQDGINQGKIKKKMTNMHSNVVYR